MDGGQGRLFRHQNKKLTTASHDTWSFSDRNIVVFFRSSLQHFCVTQQSNSTCPPPCQKIIMHRTAFQCHGNNSSRFYYFWVPADPHSSALYCQLRPFRTNIWIYIYIYIYIVYYTDYPKRVILFGVTQCYNYVTLYFRGAGVACESRRNDEW